MRGTIRTSARIESISDDGESISFYIPKRINGLEYDEEGYLHMPADRYFDEAIGVTPETVTFPIFTAVEVVFLDDRVEVEIVHDDRSAEISRNDMQESTAE